MLAACGGGDHGGASTPPVQTYTVGGSVTGLSGTVVLQDNGGDNLSIGANGAFTFARALAAGGSYSVTVLTQPTDQTCTVSGGTGTVNANVSAVAVACTLRQYTVGGTVSGLVRPVVLQNNLGDDLTVSADGTFVFAATVGGGGSYSVTVLSAPAAEVCTVSNGSGVAHGSVTSVAVSCSVDPGAFFIPFKARGQSAVPGGIYAGPWPPPTNGTNGLMVVPSDAISSGPTFLFKGWNQVVGVSQQFTVGTAGRISAGAPSALVYATQGVSGGDHLWAVDLSGGSALVPRQISNLSGNYARSEVACSYAQAFKHLSDPASAFFILGFTTDPYGNCGGGSSYQYLLVRLSDSASTTPTTLTGFPGSVLALYDPAGALAGFLAVDLSAHQLVFYADETFTNPQVLLPGVYNGLSTYQAAPSASQFLFSLSDTPQFAFVGVMGSDSSLTLYRVDYTGSVSSALYHFQGMIGGWLQDAQSVYFTNETSVSGSAAVSILRVPLDGSAPAQVLYTDTAVANTQQLSFVGASGNTLVLMREPTLNSATGSVTVAGSIETLSVGAPGVPTTIASVPAEFSAALVGTNIYIDSVTPASDPAYGSVHSTQIITIDGTVVQSVMAQSSFVSDAWGAPLVQARGISDPGGLGGGSLYLLDPAAPGAASPAQVKVSGGAPFSIAAKTATAWLAPIGSNISIGSSGGNGAPGLTLIYDSLKNQIASFSVPQTDVSGVAPGN